jgi:hypothetical protein
MAGKRVKAVLRRDQRGMTTAEYAVGSVAVATGVGVLITIFDQPWFQELLKALVTALFEVIKQMLGGA